MRIAKAGWSVIFRCLVGAGLGLFLLPLSGPSDSAARSLAAVGLVWAVFAAYFFRDPERPSAPGPQEDILPRRRPRALHRAGRRGRRDHHPHLPLHLQRASAARALRRDRHRRRVHQGQLPRGHGRPRPRATSAASSAWPPTGTKAPWSSSRSRASSPGASSAGKARATVSRPASATA